MSKIIRKVDRIMYKIGILILVTILVMLQCPLLTNASQGQQVAYALGSTAAPYGFYEYLPQGYDDNPDMAWPVVIFLHGAGERGNGTTDLYKVLTNGPPQIINSGTQFDFICISPQSIGRWDVSVLDEMVEYVKTNYRVDLDRIYLTGLSMGGGGTWEYAASYPEKLAAIVPICGNSSSYNGTAIATANLPVWAFHSWGDVTVASTLSMNWCNSIAGAIINSSATDMLANYPGTYTGLGSDTNCDATRTANFTAATGWVWSDGVVNTEGSQVALTLYNDTLHDSWARTYGNQVMWDWLLSKNKSNITPTPTATPTPTPTPTLTPTPTSTETIQYQTIKCRFGSNKYLYDDTSGVLHTGYSVSDDSYKWLVEDVNGYKRIKNKATGNYLNLQNEYAYAECSGLDDSWTSMDWTFEDVDSSYVRIKCRSNNEYLHQQNALGYVEHTSSVGTWWSAQWIFNNVD